MHPYVFRMPMPRQRETAEADAPPCSQDLTDYDRAHLVFYLRLLDAMEEDADPDEIARILLGIDPVAEPERAKRVLDAHVERALWMTKVGYRHLLWRGYH